MPTVPPETRAAPCCEPIEPRVLYSADPAPVVLTSEVGQAFVQVQAAQPAAPVESGALQGQQAVAPRELVVVDARVPQAAELVDALNRERAEGRALDVFVLDAQADGIDQIKGWLEAADVRYDAVHLLAHGEPGRLLVGGSTLDLQTLRARAGDIAAWGGRLSADADLMLYGCDLAADPSGRDLVDALAAITGADVAASLDATGHSSLNGDWELEYRHGTIDAASALDDGEQFRWQGLLSTTVLNAGADSIVNLTTTGAQQTAANAAGRQVAINASGVSVVVWRDESATANGEIKARLFDANGVDLSGEILVSSDTSKTQDEPSVAIDASGRFVVVWTQGNGADGSGKGIYGRTFDAGGNATSSAFLVNSVTSQDQWLAQVAIHPNAASAIDFYVTWTRYFNSSGTNGVQARAFQWDGTEVIGEFDVNTTGTNHQQNSSIAYAGDGTALIVWQSLSQDGDGWGIYGQRLTSSGARSGGEFRINTTTANDQFNPDVSADAAGNFVVVWTSDVGGGDKFDVVGQRISASGSKIGGEFTVSQTTAQDQTDAAVAMGEDGRFVVGWQSASQDQGGTNGVYAREFRPDGSAAGNEFLVNVTVSGDQIAPSAAYANGRAVIVWSGRSDVSAPADTDGVFMRRLSVVTPQLVIAPSGAQTTENGVGTVTLSVQLNAAPASDVVVDLTSSDASEGVVGGPGTLTFNASNWNVAQSVVVTGVDDTLVDGAIGFAVNLSSVSAATEFNGLTAAASLSNLDDDTVNRVVVDTNAQTVDGDTTSLAALLSNRGSDGKISLAEAIRATNRTANGPGGADRIEFDLSGAAGYRISLTTALEAISDAVVIDGQTDPAYAGRPVVELSRTSGSFDGLTLAAGSAGSVIRGLGIHAIAGNGIVVHTANNLIEANYIGVNPTTSAASGNFLNGISLRNGANFNTITGNTIGANSGAAIRIDSAHNNRVLGNFIGTDDSGTANLHNAGDGVTLLNSATLNRIGGVVGTEANIIAFNAGRAIAVGNFSGTSSSNSFVGNSIYGNGFGIDLDPSATNFSVTPAATANDALDADAGPNGLQNTPVLTRADWASGNVTLGVALDATPNTHFRIEFFASSVADASGHGQASQYLGFVNVAANASGHAEGTLTVALPGGPGTVITATATRTDSTYTNLFDTSEFAANALASNLPITLSGGTIAENSAAGESAGTASIDTVGTIAYTLLDDAGGRFTIGASSGELRLASGVLLDHEVTSSYQVTVRAVSSGGVMRVDTFTIAVGDVNEAPKIIAPSSATTAEDELLRLAVTTGNGIELVDPDLAQGPMTVTLNATLGRFTLATVGGLSFALGDGIDDDSAEFTGSLADLRAALSSLQFAPLTDATGEGALQVVVRDAADPALHDAHRIELTLTPVNDAPAVVAAGPLALESGQSLTIDSTLLAAADVDNSADELGYLVTRAPVNGTLTLSGLALSVGSRFTQADVNAGRLSLHTQAAATARTDSIGLTLGDGRETVPVNVDVKLAAAAALGQQSARSTSDTADAAKSSSAARSSASSASAAAVATAAPVTEAAAIADVGSAPVSKGASRPLAGFGSLATSAIGGTAEATSRSSGESADRRGDAGQTSTHRGAVLADPSRRFGMDMPHRRDTTSTAVAERRAPEAQASLNPAVRRNVALRNELDRIRETLEERVTLERNITASTATLTASASIGYIIWLLRGGVLLSSLLASVPSWMSLDPLPILSSAGRRPGEPDEDDSLQGMLKKASAERADGAQDNEHGTRVAGAAADQLPAGAPHATKLPLRNAGFA